ncbi:hypothetical protein STEG23_026563 [Scotinomys teguina]
MELRPKRLGTRTEKRKKKKQPENTDDCEHRLSKDQTTNEFAKEGSSERELLSYLESTSISFIRLQGPRLLLLYDESKRYRKIIFLCNFFMIHCKCPSNFVIALENEQNQKDSALREQWMQGVPQLRAPCTVVLSNPSLQEHPELRKDTANFRGGVRRTRSEDVKAAGNCHNYMTEAVNFYCWNMGLEPGTGTWDWNLGLEPGTGTWGWNLGLEPGTGTWDWNMGLEHGPVFNYILTSFLSFPI